MFLLYNMASSEQSCLASAKRMCKYCKKNVLNGQKCSICGASYHFSCGNRVKICCDKELAVKPLIENPQVSITEEMYLKEENALLRQLVSDKQTIIDDKESIIVLLQEKIFHLTEKLERKSCNSNDINIEIAKDEKKRHRKNIEKTDNLQGHNISEDNEQLVIQDGTQESYSVVAKSGRNKIGENYKENSEEILEAADKITSSNKITNEQGTATINVRQRSSLSIVNQENNEGFTAVKRKPRRTLTVGTNKNSDIKATPKNVSLHVYRLAPDTTVEDLTNVLKINFPEAICEKLNSRFPDIYSSFKVTINDYNFKKATDSSLWPNGACISHFFVKNRRIGPTV